MSRIVLKQFQFFPQVLSLSVDSTLEISIGENRASSQIYSNQERFFIITIGDLEESDPLYEGSLFTFSFRQEGEYIVKCANYTQAKAKITVHSHRSKVPEPNQHLEIWELRPKKLKKQ